MKARARDALGVGGPAGVQRLAFGGQQLEDSWTLAEWGVPRGAALCLVHRTVGGASGAGGGTGGRSTTWAERARFSQAFSRAGTALTITVEKSAPTRIDDLFGLAEADPPIRPTLYIFDRDAARLAAFRAGQALLRGGPIDSFRGANVLEAFPPPTDAARLADEYNALVDRAPQGRLALATAERVIPPGMAPWLIRPAMGRGGIVREEDKGAWATRVVRSLGSRGLAVQAPYLCAVRGAIWLAGACPQGTTRLAREARELGFECKVSVPDDTVVVVRLRPANVTLDSSTVAAKYVEAFIIKHNLARGEPAGDGDAAEHASGAGEAVQLGRADVLVDETGCAQLVWTASVAPGYRLQCGTFVGLHRGVSTTLSFERPVTQASAATAAGAAQGGPTEAPRMERLSLRTPVSPWRTQGRARPPQTTPQRPAGNTGPQQPAGNAGARATGASPAKRRRQSAAQEPAGALAA